MMRSQRLERHRSNYSHQLASPVVCCFPTFAVLQAMALQHGPGVIEVATNLIGLDWTTQHNSSSRVSHVAAAASAAAAAEAPGGAGPEQVMAAIATAAAQQGLPPPGPGYVTNKLPHELIEAARQAGLR
jgi:hypothetical protein